MNGKNNNGEGETPFHIIFEMQKLFQEKVTQEELPKDNVEWFSYHVQAMQEEMGEVLKADKRWKTHRNAYYNRNEKLDELADVFITAINLSLFSGITPDEMYFAIINKINANIKRLNEVQANDNNSGGNR